MDGESKVLGEAYLKIDPTSAGQARAHIRAWIGADHPAYENVRLATSELVTNAVVHTGRPRPHDLIMLTLTQTADLFYLAVTDPGGTSWRPRTPEAVPDDEESGRGLAIVGEISVQRWGVRDHGDLGRTVWCALDTGSTPAEPACG
ncbi:ATP-binding protein [Streptosporangium sp. NBC_01639]|uniref:ATP-binding protein n=1 Tax=Streptosporangium sp. NBC_01639 TaxID=2975948 RepID=UPI0038684106|nr:ATP-binding protein [Streptosporangium sp. NBC_01639]